MAVGACKLSQKLRNLLLILATLLTIIQAMLGFGILNTGITISLTVGNKLHPIDKTQFDKIFVSATIVGVSMIVIHIYGVKLCHQCVYSARNSNTAFIIILWLSVGFLMSMTVIIMASIGPRSSQSLLQLLHSSLYRGMGQYLTDPTWKETIDHLHQDLQCCGTANHTDWHKTAWINMDLLREDSETVLQYAEIDGRVLPPVVPWSCCKANLTTPCLHDPLQQSGSTALWQNQDSTILQTIYNEGCLNVMQPILMGALTAITSLATSNFLLQILNAVLLRYFYTCVRNSILLGDPSNPALGWLVGPGDFGCKFGANLIQLNELQELEAEQHSVARSESEEEVQEKLKKNELKDKNVKNKKQGASAAI